MAGSTQFGNDLRDARQQAGLTQVKLAQQLGVDPGAISGWERGIRMPDGHNRDAVAEFMGLTLAQYLVQYEAGQQNGPALHGEEAGTRARKRVAEAQRLSEEELRLLRRLIARLEGTG